MFTEMYYEKIISIENFVVYCIDLRFLSDRDFFHFIVITYKGNATELFK